MQNELRFKAAKALYEYSINHPIDPSYIMYDHLKNEIIGVYTDINAAKTEIRHLNIGDMEEIIIHYEHREEAETEEEQYEIDQIERQLTEFRKGKEDGVYFWGTTSIQRYLLYTVE